MGTEKRERQKANRQQRLIEEAKAERSAAVKRNVLRWSLAAVLAIAAVVLIAWIGGAFTGDDETETTIPEITVPVETVPVDTTPEVTTAPGDTTPADEASGKPSVLVPEETPTELVVTVIEEGTGDPAEAGDTVEVNYVGVRSEDGVEFDNSYDRGSPFSFTIGAGQVIDGWDQGVEGATEGSIIQLDIPADLAYGDADRGVIRPGDSLSFVIEVVSITPGDAE
ncbi:peptidylprolyl isomerase [Ilumatobacter fluminis]|uniref:Peptidyl-prolyl cis-trans isomerase n=1 Tax=Ilumatobacter fluminis TaxID=467091 RepID=A0A4R7HVX8_9ACTN|nr:FKBP-type peptidyl-prolyl cis-trans isomerase [Ilumatobacter fluminis]TDT15141.1 peptidylprolyl isomerase [Ilumatobacter fluminis]